jgi:tetratricopeptide (TPR) repeat protein
MTKISLRAYNKEIESLVDRGQLDEAIAHCKNILKYYPKHVNTYRLLGKAYLEAKRFTEASDILQRVLAAFPDDFIAHIGMSMIREDEGNMDAAIWHMERAFEVQPSHSAVQDELRRLYGRRDGMEPPKVRLTRGALVRMYAKSELYAQAIAEIHNALSEDNKRIDLEAILARMLLSSGNRLEAAEVSSRLIKKSPFCFEANKILETILPNTTRSEDIQTYHSRVLAMEPYAAFLTPNIVNVEDIPENSVMLEKLDYQANSFSGEPDWSKAIGVGLQEDSDTLPDWLQSNAVQSNAGEMVPSQSAATPAAVINQEERTNPPMSPNQNNRPEDEQVPDWMRAAGWNAGGEDSAPNPDDNYLNSKEESDFGIEPADIPDWLKNVSPEPPTPEKKTEDDSKLELLDSLLSGSPSQSDGKVEIEPPLPDWLNESASPVNNEQISDKVSDELPTWLNDDSTQTTGAEKSEMPDWLSDLQPKEEPLPENPPAQENTTIPSWDLPDWLNKEEQSTEQPLQQSSENLPDWLNTAEENNSSQPAKPSSSLNWLDEISNNKSNIVEPAIEEIIPSTPLAETPFNDKNVSSVSNGKDTDGDLSWLDNLSETKETEDLKVDLPTAGINDLPSTINEEVPSLNNFDSNWLAEDQSKESTPDVKSNESALDWLNNIDRSEESISEVGQGSDSMPDWLRSIDEKEKAEQEEQPLSENSYALPDWLKSLEKEDQNPSITKADSFTPQSDPVKEPPSEIPQTDVIPQFDERNLTAESIDSKLPADEQPERDITIKTETYSPPVPEMQSETSFPATSVDITEESIEPVAEKTIPKKRTSKLDDASQTDESEGTQLLSQDLGQTLNDIENMVIEGKIADASVIMDKLIRESDHLEEIIQFLREALYRHPIDIFFWQSLGDALARDNKLQEALDAYTKAEELLK